MKQAFKITLLITLFSALGPSLQAQESVGVIAKSSGTTFHKKFNADDYSPKAIMGTQLKNHDWIKTGKDGFIAIFFLDDKSQLKIKGDSEVEILAAVERGKISKTISLDYGTVKATVTKQKGEFRIATPTSVASVKGTEWWVQTDENGDIFIVIDGVVEVENLVSGVVQNVGQDQTATSNTDGSVDVGATQSGDIPDDPEDPGNDGDDATNIHELKIKMKNEETNAEKFIIIEFSE
ncbi:MAG: FecR family protein [Candidatus Marinimicrobia bacterium]|nr:FecR family protein [Candidatus Neomarinimicrobiota bacterium]MCF7905278.1 FecR family protein [Candidatus Neomarinimicrobiota bacterium]